MKRIERSSEPRRRRNAVSPKGNAVTGRRPLPQPNVRGLPHRPREAGAGAHRALPAGELSVDLRGKAPGRGAYLDPDRACLERGLREGALAKALEIPIEAVTAARLAVELEQAALVRQKETA